MGDKAARRKHAALLKEISALLDEPARGDTHALLARVEDVLTTGYARAHALEAERWRLGRQLGSLAASADDGDTAAIAAEMKTLARRASAAEHDRAGLLAVLSSLRAPKHAGEPLVPPRAPSSYTRPVLTAAWAPGGRSPPPPHRQ